jgi:hypothetical protein
VWSDLQPSRFIGGLFVLSGIFGIVILALDSVLRSGAPQHYDALIGFVIIDFLLGALCFPMPQKLMFRLAAIWSILRILIQLGDVMLGPMFQFTNAQFADYLFNPLSSLPVSLGNPPGIPPVPIDLILICDLAILLTVARARMKK